MPVVPAMRIITLWTTERNGYQHPLKWFLDFLYPQPPTPPGPGKGADLAHTQEEGAPEDGSVRKHWCTGISGRTFISLTYSKKAAFFFTFMFFRALNALAVCNKLPLVITASLFWVLLLEVLIFNVCYTRICVENLKCI